MPAEFFLAGMGAQEYDGCMKNRLTVGRYTGSGAVMLRPLRFQCAGIWISTGIPCIFTHN